VRTIRVEPAPLGLFVNMIELAIISALAGAVLGLRFKVLVLLPSTGVVLVVALGIGIATAHSFSSIAN
jgi:hypothetical protein